MFLPGDYPPGRFYNLLLMNIYDVDITLIDTESGEILVNTKLPDITFSSQTTTGYLSRWLACFVRGCCKGNNLSLEFNAKLKAF